MKKFLTVMLTTAMVVSNFGISNIYASQAPTLQILTDAKYDEMGAVTEDRAWARKGNTYCYLDTNGKEVTDYFYITENDGDYLNDYSNGFAKIFIVDKNNPEISDVIYIDKNGKTIIKGSDITSSKDNIVGGDFTDIGALIQDKTTDTMYLIDKTGKVLSKSGSRIDDSTKIIGCYDIIRDGLIPAAIEKHTDAGMYDIGCGYLDTNFKIKIKPTYEDALPFSQGLAPVMLDEKWGVIDKNNNMIIKPAYDEILFTDKDFLGVFNEGIAEVRIGKKWGFIDMKGNKIGDIKYELVSPFTNGRAVVMVDGKWGIIDSKGKIIVNPKFTDINNFTNEGYAVAGINSTYKIIDKNGDNVSSQTWDFDCTLSNKFSPSFIAYEKNGKWGLAKIVVNTVGGLDNNIPENQANTNTDINVVYKNSTLKLNLPILNRDGTTYYPFRDLLTAMDAKVDWDSTSNSATGTLNGNKVKFTIGNNVYEVNGKEQQLPSGQVPFIENGRTYIPIRACAEGLGFKVTWDVKSNTITIE